MTHHVGEHTPTLPFALPEPGFVRAGMLLRRAGQIGPSALGYGAPPDDVLAAHHRGREQLVLQIAVQQACVLDKREHFARRGAPAFVIRWISRMMSRRVSLGVSSQSASTSPDIAIASRLSNAFACPR